MVDGSATPTTTQPTATTPFLFEIAPDPTHHPELHHLYERYYKILRRQKKDNESQHTPADPRLPAPNAATPPSQETATQRQLLASASPAEPASITERASQAPRQSAPSREHMAGPSNPPAVEQESIPDVGGAEGGGGKGK